MHSDSMSCIGFAKKTRVALGGAFWLPCLFVGVRRWRWLFDKLFHWVSGALSHGSVRFCMVVGAGVVVGSGRGASVWVSGLQGNVAGLLGLLLY